eukprot:COSAG02_NODE_58407_length_277_cov_0.876404_1_plen_91_part_11
MMRKKIMSGAFTAHHYICMWSVRLDETLSPQRRAELLRYKLPATATNGDIAAAKEAAAKREDLDRRRRALRAGHRRHWYKVRGSELTEQEI